MPAAPARRHPLGGSGSCRARTLWIILRRSRKRRLDEPPEAVLVVGSSRSSAAYGSTTMTAESTVGRRLEGRRRDPQATRTRGVVLDEDGEVAHLPGRRRDPLGDLALDHQHEPLRPRRLARAADAGSGW